MDERVHFTGSDARLVFLNHPEQELVGQPLDAAHYVITGGSSPVHIWNYARQKEGGAPFDDTAIGNHLAELQLVMNQDRFESTAEQFRDNPVVGDMLLMYQKHGNWGQIKRSGYKLLGGRVGSVGEEITLKNATYPTISLKFKEILARRGESQQPQEGGAGDILELRESEERPEQAKYWPVEGYYVHKDRRKAFAPQRQGTPSGDPFEESQFVGFRRYDARFVRVGPDHNSSAEDWLESRSTETEFISAFVEIGLGGPAGGSRKLYAWSTVEKRYKSTGRTSSHLRSPILDTQ